VRSRFMLAIAIVSLAVSNGHAEHQLPPVTPHQPVLRESADAEVCGAFTSAWMEIYRGGTSLREELLDIEAAFPEADVFTLPPPNREGGFNGLYNRSFHRALDFDGDGKPEVLHIESDDIGWRYLGAKLYLFGSEEEYLEAKAASEKERPGRDFFFTMLKEPLDSAPKHLLDYPPADVVFVFSLNGAVYTTASAKRTVPDGPLTATLVRLNGRDGPQQVCAVDLLPRYADLQAFIEGSELYQALKSFYGTPDYGCIGSGGWRAPDPEEHLLTLFHRPQAMIDMYDHPISVSEGAAAAREIRLLVWGVSDPMSWSVYRRLKNGRTEFVRQMTSYYRQYFEMANSDAQELAEHAYRFLIDRIIYYHYEDQFRLTAVAQQSEDRLNIGSESSSEAVAAAAIEGWLRVIEGWLQDDSRPRPVLKIVEDGVWREAVLAALYTRQAPARVGALWTRLQDVLAAQEVEADAKEQRARIASKRTTYLNDMLLAALGDRALTELVLSFGADVDAPTNWFRKTPLMYAAQTDDLATVQFLLANGADPSSQTSDADGGCHRLERDGRTPLMYAAEYGSPELIETLLAAGADVAASDTKGNTANWYLERNRKLSETENTPLRKRLSSTQ